jgi:hypothetical protein
MTPNGRRRALLVTALLGLSSCLYGQNLVADGGFATALEAWHHDPNTNGSSAWSASDASGAANSGSARLSSTAAVNGVFIGLLTQCVPVASGQSYVLSHKARFADGEATTGWAETEISWFSGPICTSRLSGNAILTSKAGSGTWTTTTDTFTAPAGSISALVEVGIDKIEPGATLTADIDDVSFAPSGEYVETLVSWLPVVGSVRGAFDSNFRTSLRILNAGSSPQSGRLVFHPVGQPESAADPSMGYSLAPGQSFAWNDVVAAMGLSGLGSLDVTGGFFYPSFAPPVVVVRVFNDAGEAGTTGFTEPQFEAQTQHICCTLPVITGFLLPPDLERYRYNVGIRVLEPLQLTVDVLDPAGRVVHTLTRTYATATLTQTTADEFAGVPLQNGQSLRVTLDPGLAIVYGATADNVTQDPSAQFLTVYPVVRP